LRASLAERAFPAIHHIIVDAKELTMAEKPKKKRSADWERIATGVGIGLVFGLALGNIGAGIAFGVAIAYALDD
jgi:cytochrome bd-type quinol oxidase subunit 2